MKKLIIVFLLIVLIGSTVYSAGYPVIDVSVLFQTLLQKMQDAEHFVKEIEQWKQVLDHYSRQYEQIKRYYQELEGIANKFANSSDFMDYWNNSKDFLSKLIDITKAQARIEDMLYSDGIKLMNQTAEAQNLIADIISGDNIWEKARLDLINQWGNRIYYYEDTFLYTVRKNVDAWNRMTNQRNDSISYWTAKKENANRELETLTAQLEKLNLTRLTFRSLIAPHREDKFKLEEAISKQRAAALAYEADNMANMKAGSLTEGQRTESIAMTSSFQNTIAQLESQLESTNRVIDKYDGHIMEVENLIDSLMEEKDAVEFEILTCDTEINRLNALEVRSI